MGGGKRVFVKNATCKYHTLFQFCTKQTIAGGPGKIPRSEARWPCRFSWWPAHPGQCGVLASTWSRFRTCTRGWINPGVTQVSVSKWICSRNWRGAAALPAQVQWGLG